MTTVLVIDDHNNHREEIVTLLEFEGYRILSATNGAEGLQLARQYQPDLILCDIMMPEMDGYETLNALRNDSRTRSIPVIFLTVKAERAEVLHGLQVGANGYLTKPYGAKELLSAIAAQLPA